MPGAAPCYAARAGASGEVEEVNGRRTERGDHRRQRGRRLRRLPRQRGLRDLSDHAVLDDGGSRRTPTRASIPSSTCANDQVFAANVFYQDFLVRGFTLEGLVLDNWNNEGDRNPHYNTNGFLERPMPAGDEQPHNYNIIYPGIGGDGHFGRLNLTTQLLPGAGARRPQPDRAATAHDLLLAPRHGGIGRLRLVPTQVVRLSRQGRRQPVRRHRRRLRRDLREPELRGRLDELLGAAGHPVHRRRRRGAQGSELAPPRSALVEARGTVELRQPGLDAGGRRGGLRRLSGAPRPRQRVLARLRRHVLPARAPPAAAGVRRTSATTSRSG